MFNPTIDMDLSLVKDHLVYKQIQNIIENKGNAIHYALFPNKNVIQALISGAKQLESRFSKFRIDPYGRVDKGDIVLMRETGRKFFAYGLVCEVRYFERGLYDRFDRIKQDFNDLICADDYFWEMKSNANYATLMNFAVVERIPFIKVKKSDSRGWVVLKQRDDIWRGLCQSPK